MCLIAFAWQVDARFPLVVAANRDEFYARPTEPAHWWPEHPDLFAGRDLRAGGSWLGINKNGRFAALTNIRAAQKFNASAASRGALVTDFLQADVSAQEYAHAVLHKAEEYNGFNLLLGSRDELVYCNNQQLEVRSLDAGVYALSNATLDVDWPKTKSARNKLRRWLESPVDCFSLARLLDSRRIAAHSELPATGVSPILEQALSAEYIELPEYGTRCQTGILVDSAGLLNIVELSVDQESSSQQQVESFW